MGDLRLAGRIAKAFDANPDTINDGAGGKHSEYSILEFICVSDCKSREVMVLKYLDEKHVDGIE